MIQQSKGKIFLADQRGVNQTEQFQSMHTFNFGKYFDENKNSFGDIYLLNDDTIAGGGEIKMLAKEPSHILLVPVAGAINYTDNAGNNNLIAAGQVLHTTAVKGDMMAISNPFREDLVNFLQIWIRAGKTKIPGARQLVTYNDVNENLNSLVKVIPVNGHNAQLPFIVSIGKFSGRGETVYLPKNKKNALFVFVIEGAFEVEGRLLHARDGLGLWETGVVEMEALSNDAILLVAEHPL